jgi:hypothetical protein
MIGSKKKMGEEYLCFTSQSPLIGAMIGSILGKDKIINGNTVSIPSNRGNDWESCAGVNKRRQYESQSPLIGAMIGRIWRCQHADKTQRSQSPLIGAMIGREDFLPHRAVLSSLNPL